MLNTVFQLSRVITLNLFLNSYRLPLVSQREISFSPIIGLVRRVQRVCFLSEIYSTVRLVKAMDNTLTDYDPKVPDELVDKH